MSLTPNELISNCERLVYTSGCDQQSFRQMDYIRRIIWAIHSSLRPLEASDNGTTLSYKEAPLTDTILFQIHNRIQTILAEEAGAETLAKILNEEETEVFYEKICLPLDQTPREEWPRLIREQILPLVNINSPLLPFLAEVEKGSSPETGFRIALQKYRMKIEPIERPESVENYIRYLNEFLTTHIADRRILEPAANTLPI